MIVHIALKCWRAEQEKDRELKRLQKDFELRIAAEAESAKREAARAMKQQLADAEKRAKEAEERAEKKVEDARKEIESRMEKLVTVLLSSVSVSQAIRSNEADRR